MSRRTTGLALVALIVIVLTVFWFLSRSTEAPAVASDPIVAPVLAAHEPANLAVDEAPAAEVPERTIAKPSEAVAAAPAGSSKPARPETLIYGSLLDESGAPILGAWSAGVSLIDHNGRRRFADAKDEGAYAIHALPFGTYDVTAGAHGYQQVETTLDLRPEQLVVRKDFTLSKSVVIKVKVVTPEGQDALAGMKTRARLSLVPVATRDLPGPRMPEITGSLNNRFGVGSFWNYGPPVESLPPGYLGVIILTCDLPVHVSLVNYQAVLATQRVEPGTDEVVFVMAPDALSSSLATIRLRTVDAETGDPIGGVRVMLSGTAASDMGSATDEKGIALLENRAAGHFQMRLMGKDYEHLSRAIDAEPGQVTDLGDIALDKAVIVQGRLVDAEGKGVGTEFNLGVVDPATGAIDMDRNMQFASDATGAFTLNGLGRKQYVLRTDNHDALNDENLEGVTWVSGNVLINARAGPITGLEIRLHKAAMLVLRVKGESPEGLRFRVEDPEGRVLAASRFYGPGPRPLKLPPGTYRAALLDADGNVLAQKSATLGSQTLEVELAR